MNRLTALCLAATALAASAPAQQRNSAPTRPAGSTRAPVPQMPPTRVTSSVPVVQEPPAPSTDAGAAATQGTMGNKPFTLIVDQTNGVMDFKFNENNEVEGVKAKVGVILSSEEMTLNADHLDYDMISSKLVASGKRVVVRQGEVIATCQLFKYDPNTQESTLLGTPVVYNKDKNGQVSTTRGNRIEIKQVDGKAVFKVYGGVLDTGGVGGGAPSAPAGGVAPAPSRIDPSDSVELENRSAKPARSVE